MAGEPEDTAWTPRAGRPAGVAGWAKDMGETAHSGVKGGKKGGGLLGMFVLLGLSELGDVDLDVRVQGMMKEEISWMTFLYTKKWTGDAYVHRDKKMESG